MESYVHVNKLEKYHALACLKNKKQQKCIFIKDTSLVRLLVTMYSLSTGGVAHTTKQGLERED